LSNRSSVGRSTAEDFLNELRRDPQFLSAEKQRALERRRNRETYYRAAAPVLRDLVALGFQVESVGDLRRRYDPYLSAVPVLVKWLPKVQDTYVKEDIIRTLWVPWAGGEATQALMAEFEAADDDRQPGLRWVIADALATVAGEGDLEGIARLARDRRFGSAREMLTDALGKMRSPEARMVLLELSDDPEIAARARAVLMRLDATSRKNRRRSGSPRGAQ
jgi:hypothetical protein